MRKVRPILAEQRVQGRALKPSPTAEPTLLTMLCCLTLSSLREPWSRPARLHDRTPCPYTLLSKAPLEAPSAGGAASIAVPSPRVQPPLGSGWRRTSRPNVPAKGSAALKPPPSQAKGRQYLRKTRPGSCPELCGKHLPPPQPTWQVFRLEGVHCVGGNGATPYRSTAAWCLPGWGLRPLLGAGRGRRARGARSLGAPLVLPERGGSVRGPSGIDWGSWRGSQLAWRLREQSECLWTQGLGGQSFPKSGVFRFNKNTGRLVKLEFQISNK